MEKESQWNEVKTNDFKDGRSINILKIAIICKSSMKTCAIKNFQLVSCIGKSK